MKIQSLEEFYRYKFTDLSDNFKQDSVNFNVFSIGDNIKSGVVTPPYIRRDFYKIMLFQGSNIFHYGDKSIPISGNTLLFFNPQVPYTYEPLDLDAKGYFCVFKHEFFKENLRLHLNEIPLFAPGVKPVFSLDAATYKEINFFFEKMISEMESEYIYKYELIKNYVGAIIYYAMKLQPSETLFQHPDASTRITAVFTELLERQFPIESASQRFAYRSPKDFADRLSVHVNYLNRAIKKATGKTTTEHISERLTSEAKALLKHTNWNIAEISHMLGFDDQAHFNNFFKKHCLMNPSAFRKV